MPARGRLPWLWLMLAASVTACSSPERVSRHQWYLFGTVVTVTSYGAEPAAAEVAAQAIFNEFTIIDSNWYPWSTERGPASGEIFRINRAIATGDTITVSTATAQMLRRASELELLSDGRFNPAIGGLIELWGFADPLQTWSGPPEDKDISALLEAAPSTRQLRWHGDDLSATSTAVVLDPGGIAKGAILETALAILEQHGIHNAVVDIGGDLAVVGRHDGKLMRIGIKNPSPDNANMPVLGWALLSAGETAFTSGSYERFFVSHGKHYQHIIDPLTGRPVEHTISVTVIDRDPMLADAAATALLVAGADDFSALSSSMGIRDALLISASGERHMTASMAKRMHWIQR